MKKLALLGAGGHGKVVADVAEATGWQDVSFFDMAWPKVTQNGAWPVKGDMTTLLEKIAELDGIVVAIGDCQARFQKQAKIVDAGGRLATLIHPSAIVSRYALIGQGVVVMPGAIINCGAVVGDGCIINSGAIVEHDCTLGEAVHIAPGAVISGNVTVGDRSWVGVGAIARQGAFIGQEVMVGAGAVVINRVENRETVVGCPAAPLQKHT